MSDSFRSHGLQPARFLCLRNSPDKNTGVGNQSLLQGFLTQGSKPVSCIAEDSLLSEPPGQSGQLPYPTPNVSSFEAEKHWLILILFVHSFNKYLLSTYYAPGSETRTLGHKFNKMDIHLLTFSRANWMTLNQ